MPLRVKPQCGSNIQSYRTMLQEDIDVMATVSFSTSRTGCTLPMTSTLTAFAGLVPRPSFQSVPQRFLQAFAAYAAEGETLFA